MTGFIKRLYGHRVLRRLIQIEAALGAVASLSVTSANADAPPNDPICFGRSRSSAGLAARAAAARQALVTPKQLLSAQPSATAFLGLAWDRTAGAPRLLLHGTPGQSLQVDAVSDFSSPVWQPWLRLNLAGSNADWLDSVSGIGTSRFFRLEVIPPDSRSELADDFQLLDHTGAARQLFYPTQLRALTVACVGGDSSELPRSVLALDQLAGTYPADTAQFWVLLADPTASRTNVAAQLASLSTNVPVLLDPEQLGIQALHMTHAGEVVVLEPPNFIIAYRGQLETGAPEDAPAAKNGPVAAAVSGLLQSKPFTLLRTPLAGPLLSTASIPAPDYATEVAPVLHDYCVKCHRPGDVAPFALTNYSVAVDWAAGIKNELLTGQMPPWHVDPAYGHWSNNLALPTAARATLIRWINAGTPRGKGPDPLAESPLPPSYRDWPAELGEPDALVTCGEQSVALTGSEPYRYLFVQSPNPTNVWLKAAIIRPSNPAVVHHYLVWTGKVGNKGFEGFSTYQAHLAAYVPGVPPYIYPSDAGYFLGTSNWLTFNLHYTPNRQDTNDTPVLALWYHKTPPPKKFHDEGIANVFFVIPPGEADYPVAAQWTAPHEVRLQRLNPHMHLRGKRVTFEALYPDGSRETLLSVPDYSFRWQTGYEFAEPKTIPGGTQILVRGAFDNSPQNINNPDSTASVWWGDQTTSEMFVGFVDYVD